jgi:hypothetical protein
MKAAKANRTLITMIAASMGSWLVVAMLVDQRTSVEVLCGMLGPLVMVGGTIVAAQRTVSRNPEALMSMMVGAFAGKMVFFAAYIAVMLRLLSLHPAPFVVGFTSYFIALYLMAALYLRRLFLGRVR